MKTRDVLTWVKLIGPRPVVDRALGKAISTLMPKAVRAFNAPSLDAMLAVADGSFCRTPEELMSRLDLPVIDKQLERQFSAHQRSLQQRRELIGGTYHPDNWAVEEKTAKFLYLLTRALRPTTVVETGVAAGNSSYYILAALSDNEHGHLHSFDIDPHCGALVEDRRRWDLCILKEAVPHVEYARILQRIGAIDIFFHDGDHSYTAQLMEYRTAWQRLVAGGVLVSDDVDDTHAMIDFARSEGVDLRMLFDSSKVVGGVRKPAANHSPRA